MGQLQIAQTEFCLFGRYVHLMHEQQLVDSRWTAEQGEQRRYSPIVKLVLESGSRKRNSARHYFLELTGLLVEQPCNDELLGDAVPVE